MLPSSASEGMSTTSPETRLALGFLTRLALVAPVALAGGGIADGIAGLETAAFALAGVALTFAIMVVAFREGARFGIGGLMVAAFASLILGLGLLTAITVPLVHAHWMRLGVFATVVIAGYLVAVVLEARRVSGRIGDDGLRPWRVLR